MGTNFYWQHNPCDCCGRSEEIHIGKRSAGWKFLFRGHESPLDCPAGVLLSKAEWESVLREGNGYIRDENGETMEVEDFLTMVEERQDQPLGHSSYMEEHHPEVKNRGFTDNEGYEIYVEDFS